jgi:cytochrome bd ubiquinol oxidase subunit II
MIFDYETLKVIWWLFVGLLLIGFAVTDGFDMGVGALLPFVGRNDAERRAIIDSIVHTWEGNQVWLITGAGATFAAWPLVYAAAFSSLYVAMMLTLFALFFRPVGFDYRNKVEDPRWRAAWDWGLFIGGAAPAFAFGLVFGNLLVGVPFYFDESLRIFSSGPLWSWFNPFALLAGMVSLSMLILHGSTYLQLRTEGDIQRRAARAALISGALLIVAFAAAGMWIANGVDGYRLVAIPSLAGVADPLNKEVERSAGAWLDNYYTRPWTMLAPVLAFSGAALAILLSLLRRYQRSAFAASTVAVASVILTAGFSMFPFILPSSLRPNSSLTVWDAVSSHRTLQIMFWAVVLLLPLVCAYTAWVYHVLRGKVTVHQIRRDNDTVL